ncbi:MAG: TrsE-like protein [Candidatus Carbobacillus altaicus]|uniref:TrsE-like protein n=1 Tax=Candidatus Carbonibacillus altaicus TaxID=2163959 RepID=A0A2R6Y0Q1_9BACL|nr:MAG: TrsE-like protein [Candidatus Carbobacillus altaicus]
MRETYKYLELDSAHGSTFIRTFLGKIRGGATYFGILKSLLRGFEKSVRGNIDTVMHFLPLPVDGEIKALERKISDLIAEQARTPSPARKDTLDVEIRGLRERQLRLRTNIERPYIGLFQFIVSSENETFLESFSKTVGKELHGRGLELIPPNGEHLKALQLAVPTTNEKHDRFLNFGESLETTNVADFFPFVRYGLPYNEGIIVGYDPSDEIVIWHPWDPNLPNQHMIVIGRSGAGKSYATMLLLIRSSLWGIEHAVLDWKGEYGDIATILDIPYVSLGEKSPDRINPFDLDVLKDQAGNSYVSLNETAQALQSLVTRMLRTYDYAHRDVLLALPELIHGLYKKRGITKDPESLYTYRSGFSAKPIRKDMPTLSELYLELKNHPNPSIREASEGLKPFTRHGHTPSFAIFDGESTREELAKSPLLIIALDQLEQDVMRPIALTAVTQWLANRWAKSRPNVKKRIYVEEAQNLFLDPDAGPWLESAYRELRAYNTGMVSITQGLEVFLQNEHGRSALRNSTIKVIGKQQNVDIARVEDVLSITSGEKEYVLKAQTGNFLIRIDETSAFVTFDASVTEHMLYTSNPNDELYAERKKQVNVKLQRKRGGAL